MNKLVCLLFIASVATVLGYPTGAPETVCNTMFPEHGGAPETSPAPVRITASSNRVRPGQQVTFTIESITSGFQFRGFMIQPRLETVAGGPVGTISASASVRVVNCEGPTTGTHVDSTLRSTQTITWTAPATTGAVRAHLTLVESLSRFWMEIRSEVIDVNPNN